MNEGKSIFSQLIGFLPDRDFRRCVARYQGDRYAKKLSCWDQFLAMAFAQLAYRESLRDIEACLGAVGPKLYHMGFGSAVARSTLADANECRDWRIFADFAQVLIRTAIKLYANDAIGIADVRDLYALDSTTIDLCLSLFPWARFRKHKAAVKMHTLLDLHGSIPTFIRITDGKVHDVNILDELTLEAGAFYVMDRGYIDFERLYRFKLELAFFRRAHQEQRASPAPLLASCGEGIRCALGSDRRARVVRIGFGLSRCAAQGCLRRCGNRQAAGVLEQQIRTARGNHRRHLQATLAGGVVLQMDQATPAHQSLLRNQRERRENPNMDRCIGLCAGCHRAQTARTEDQPLPNPTGSLPNSIRENPHFTGTSADRLPGRFTLLFQPTESVRLIAGQQCEAINASYEIQHI